MKLHNITSVSYDIEQERPALVAERIIREIGEEIAPIVASWHVINESTNRYEIDEKLLKEGIVDIIKKGVGKINDAVTKGYSDIDAMKTKVVQGLKSKGDPGILSKLGELAKKNAKYVKPALMIAVVGASLLGMDTASASETLGQLGEMPTEELQNTVNSADTGAGGGQAPQEDQPTQYSGDSSTDGSQFINDFLQQAKDGGADVSAVINKLQSIKIEGLDIESYASKIEQAAAKANNYVERQNIHKYGTEQIISAIRDSSEVAQTAQGGAGDVAGQGGGGVGNKSWNSATSSWQENSTKFTDKGKDIMQNAVKNAVKNYKG